MKDTYYFSHDCNARRDGKIIALRMRHKWEGYGLFWAIIEHLRESEDYECVRDYNLIAYDLRVGSAIIKSIIEDFGLFSFTEDGKRFYSERLKRAMANKAEISSKRSAAGKKGGGNPNFIKGQSNVYYQAINQTDSELSEELIEEREINKRLTKDKQEINIKKERKGKDISLYSSLRSEHREVCAKRETFHPPVPSEVAEYARERGYEGFEAESFCDFYQSKGWMVGKNKMKDWRAAVRQWQSRKSSGLGGGGLAVRGTAVRQGGNIRKVNDDWADCSTSSEQGELLQKVQQLGTTS